MSENPLDPFLDLPEASANGTDPRRRWIVIPNWDNFQHYKDRSPAWIKLYTDLMHRDDFLELTGHQRSVLLGIWLEYASSHCQLLDSTTMLSARLRLRVTTPTLKVLSDAGFIEFSASKPLAPRYQPASPEKRRVDKNPPTPRKTRGDKPVETTKDVCPECDVGAGLHTIDCPTIQQPEVVPSGVSD